MNNNGADLINKIKKFEREIIFAIVLGIIFSSLLAFWGDLRDTFEEIISFKISYVFIVLLLTCFNYFLRFIRWRFFLGKVGFKNKIDSRKSGLIFLSGLTLTLTPGKTGEVLKAYFLKRVSNDHLSRTVPIVLTERLTDGLASILLLSLGFYSYPYGWFAIIFALFSCVIFIFLIYNDPFWVLCRKILVGLENKKAVFGVINSKLLNFREALLSLLGWKSLLFSTSLSALAWFAEALGFSLIISDIAGIDISMVLVSKTVFIFCFVSILGFVSLFPGGLGIAEGGFTGMLILLLNLQKSQAVASTILLRLLTLWWGVILGLVAFFAMFKLLSPENEKKT